MAVITAAPHISLETCQLWRHTCYYKHVTRHTCYCRHVLLLPPTAQWPSKGVRRSSLLLMSIWVSFPVLIPETSEQVIRYDCLTPRTSPLCTVGLDVRCEDYSLELQCLDTSYQYTQPDVTDFTSVLCFVSRHFTTSILRALACQPISTWTYLFKLSVWNNQMGPILNLLWRISLHSAPHSDKLGGQ